MAHNNGGPLPPSPTVADREAELAALQTAFDEYIGSSRELEDELDAELTKMREFFSSYSSSSSSSCFFIWDSLPHPPARALHRRPDAPQLPDAPPCRFPFSRISPRFFVPLVYFVFSTSP